jgi:nicotinic acid phosphoribosyltransferase
MARSYFRRRMTAPATFSLFVREPPPGRGFLVLAGIHEVCRFLEALPLRLDFCFTRLTNAGEFDWIERRRARACAALGGPSMSREAARLVIRW